MAYADQKQNRTVAIGSVALIHLGLGAALVTGLAVKLERESITVLEGKNIPIETPPPPDQPPPPEPKTERVDTPTRVTETFVAPIPRVPVTTIIDLPTTPTIPPARIDIGPPVTPAEPPTPPANLSRALQPRGDQGGWFPQDSYPAAARRAGAEGRVSVSVDVGVNGRVTACRVTSSSGNEDLDTATCRLATRNGRFEPARDAAGEVIPSTTALRNVRWRLLAD